MFQVSPKMQGDKSYLGCLDLLKEIVQTHLYPRISPDFIDATVGEAKSIQEDVLNVMERWVELLAKNVKCFLNFVNWKKFNFVNSEAELALFIPQPLSLIFFIWE